MEWKPVHYYWGHYWPTVAAPDGDDDDDECAAVGGMFGRGNRSPNAALCTTNPTRTRTAGVGSQWLTAWPTAPPMWCTGAIVRAVSSNDKWSWGLLVKRDLQLSGQCSAYRPVTTWSFHNYSFWYVNYVADYGLIMNVKRLNCTRNVGYVCVIHTL
jgi:hypothetical protein